MTQRIRVSLAFAELSDGDLSAFAGGVIDGLTAEATQFPDLPVAVAALTTLKGQFDQARAAMADAGPSSTAAKNDARQELLGGLRNDALYVEIKSDNNLATLLSSGYRASSTNRASSPLAQVEVLSIENIQSGQLRVRVKPQPNVRSYTGRIKAAGSEFGPNISFASSRKILFQGLTAGVKYTLQLCAVGGSTGQSDWSDPVERMSL